MPTIFINSLTTELSNRGTTKVHRFSDAHPFTAISASRTAIHQTHPRPGFAPGAFSMSPPASLLQTNENDIKVVQELMRHANVTTTMNVYRIMGRR